MKESKVPFIAVVLFIISAVTFLFIKTVLWQDFTIAETETDNETGQLEFTQ